MCTRRPQYLLLVTHTLTANTVSHNVLCHFLIPHSTDALYITEEPLSQAVATNGSLQLSCLAPNFNLTLWFKGSPADGLTQVQEDLRVTADGDTLELTSFHAIEHTGLYYCMVLSETVIVRSCPAYISHASKNEYSISSTL